MHLQDKFSVQAYANELHGVELPRISTIPKLKIIKFVHGFAVLC